ncbi:unnamed protein product [Paramecium sonneborni]|uniref:Uncharacterized protein n=1 Tax=Paramecium sonneborni TaxID=65129 RepID=A0A8S1RLQ2_9CILI|nr:unnamed protein product [Paramecium sonneborni]
MSNSQGVSLLENLRKVITLVDQLRDIGLNDYIKLPRIVVLGIQSAGKSSLLEHIVGIDFLPRGSGVVTRRPLELRLSNAPASVCATPTAEFVEEIKGKKFTNFEEVRQKINELTDKVCGQAKNIIDKPIILAVQGPNCPDLTLVDLPGITRIPIAGQPANIEEITTNMAKRYCEDKSAIILCVVAANADMTTSDALLLAKKLDPDGIRTIGVLTKIDIMDQGTNAFKMLKGEEVPLKYGYVGVKLRSQQEINDNIPIIQAVLREKNFFANHPVYSTIPGEIFGTQVLTRKLTTILYRRIRSFLPELMREINNRVGKIQVRLDVLGPGLPVEDSDKMHYIWKLIHEFSVRFRNSITGSYQKVKSTKKNDFFQVPAGAKIKLLFSELYDEFNDLDYQALKKYSEDDITQVIQKYSALTIPGFLPVDAFYALLNPELKRLQQPAFNIIDEAYSILEEYAIEILCDQLQTIPSVLKMLEEQVLEIIQECKSNAQNSVQDILDAEMNYVFTNDSNYLAGKQFIRFGKPAKEAQPVKGQYMVAELKNKIEHYFKLVVRSTRDNIPKLVGYFLVKGCQTKMLMQLQQNLMQNQNLLSAISEDQNIVEERKKLNKEIETFRNAQKIIKRDPDLSEYILSASEDLAAEQQQQTQQVQQIKPQQQQQQQQQQKQQDTKPQVIVQKPEINKTPVTQTQNDSSKNQLTDAQSQKQQQQNQQNTQQSQPSQLPLQTQQVKQQTTIFGTAPKTPQPQTSATQQNTNPLQGNKPSSSQTLTQQYNQQVDKGVAAFYEDERVKEQMKNAGGQAAKATVKSQIPGAPDWALNVAEKAGQQAATSDAAKQAAINATSQQLKVDDQPSQSNQQQQAPQQKKGGLFGFINKQS